MILLMSFGGYYIFIVYGGFIKYYGRLVIILLSRKCFREMDFLVVMICLFNLFIKSKIFMIDDDLLFVFSGLNISICVVIVEV